MALLTRQQAALAGITVTYAAAAAGGDTFLNDGYVILEVVNAHGTLSRTVTINSQQTCSYGFDHDQAVTVAALTTKRIGPFDPNRFNNSDQQVAVTYSDSAADLTVAAVRNII